MRRTRTENFDTHSANFQLQIFIFAWAPYIHNQATKNKNMSRLRTSQCWHSRLCKYKAYKALSNRAIVKRNSENNEENGNEFWRRDNLRYIGAAPKASALRVCCSTNSAAVATSYFLEYLCMHTKYGLGLLTSTTLGHGGCVWFITLRLHSLQTRCTALLQRSLCDRGSSQILESP